MNIQSASSWVNVFIFLIVAVAILLLLLRVGAFLLGVTLKLLFFLLLAALTVQLFRSLRSRYR